MVQECDYAIDMAVQEFAECRPNGIYKQDYLNDLLKRYGDDEEDTLQVLEIYENKIIIYVF